MRRSRSSVVGLLMVATIAAGCNDDTLPTVAEMPTTTNPALAADLEPVPEPPDAATIVAGLESAVRANDFCGLLTAMDSAQPDPADRAGAVSVYRALATATAAARPFLPAELRTAWEVVVVGTDEAATQVEEHDGDVADPEVEAALTSTAMIEALETVERHQITTCPAPTVPGG